MNRFTRAAVTVPVVGLTALLATAGPAVAAEGSVWADLTPVPVNGSTATGTAMVEINGTTLSFTLAAQGLLDGVPHAAHIHYSETARNECPTAADNTAAAQSGEVDPQQHLTASEGAPAYGDIVVSLTTSGDTTPATSALAVDRFSSDGDFEYSRGDVQITEELAADILSGESAVVIHGVDHDGDLTYSAGNRGVSDLDPALPGEATDPALCGVLAATPNGGVAAGDGSSTDASSALPYVLGGVALTAAGGAAFASRRSSRATV